jgi:hypothetical protein
MRRKPRWNETGHSKTVDLTVLESGRDSSSRGKTGKIGVDVMIRSCFTQNPHTLNLRSCGTRSAFVHVCHAIDSKRTAAAEAVKTWSETNAAAKPAQAESKQSAAAKPATNRVGTRPTPCHGPWRNQNTPRRHS